MSEIPSALSKWEPSRALKVGFLVFAALCVGMLYAAKIWDHTVSETRHLEAAVQAERRADSASDFTLADDKGQKVQLASYRGKLVFVNFWATWCAPCREEMPSLGQLASTMDPNDVVFLAVSVDESWDVVNNFLGQSPRPYKVLLDPDKTVSAKWGTTGYPESFLVGRDGNVIYKFVGARDWAASAPRKLLEQAGARAIRSAVMGG